MLKLLPEGAECLTGPPGPGQGERIMASQDRAEEAKSVQPQGQPEQPATQEDARMQPPAHPTQEGEKRPPVRFMDWASI